MLMLMLLNACGPSGTDVTGEGEGTTDTVAPPTTDTDPAETDPPTDTHTTSTFDAELSALCVNEFMAGNATALPGNGLYPDWIELHNSGTDSVDLSGWTLSDNADEPGLFAFDDGTTLAAGAFLLLFADGDTFTDDHVNFSLSAGGELIGLYAPNGDGEVVNFGAVNDDMAAARSTDCCVGSECWDVVAWGTPGLSNLTTPVPPVITTETGDSGP